MWCLYSTNEKILFQEQYLPSYSIAGLFKRLVYKLVFSRIATVQLWLLDDKIREKTVSRVFIPRPSGKNTNLVI